MRDVRDYTIEVCVICGVQLSRGTRAGRCTNQDHWSTGGMVVRVTPRPLEEQDERTTQRHWKALDPPADGRQIDRVWIDEIQNFPDPGVDAERADA